MKRVVLVPLLALGAILLGACTAGEASPTAGVVSMQFPSTQAAVATDFVQLFVFDITPEQRETVCLDKIGARKRQEPLNASLTPPPWNICELLAGRRPATIPYGEKAILAVAQRKDRNDQLQDFMIGCAVQTLGEGDAPLPVRLALLNVGTPVPETNCATVGDYCGSRCQ
jgi:hypothetical protein